MGKSVSAKRSAKQTAAAPTVRASKVLLEILSKNPDVESFTVQRIVESIAGAPVGASLMLFSIPGLVPTLGASDLAGLPTGVVAGQMIAGRKQFKLPKFILEKTVPRRSLAIAIHAILPFLKKAEKALRPRWSWTSHPVSQRVLGVLIFVLALAIAVPVLGFNAPHAASIFIISLGMVEKDGLAILVGVIAGLASLIVAAVGFSNSQLRSKAFDLLMALWDRLTLPRITGVFKTLGSIWSSLWNFEWGRLLMFWDPERSSRAARSKPRRSRAMPQAVPVRAVKPRVRRPALAAKSLAAKSGAALALPDFSRAAV